MDAARPAAAMVIQPFAAEACLAEARVNSGERGALVDADEALRVLQAEEVNRGKIARTRSWRTEGGLVHLDFEDGSDPQELSIDSGRLMQEIRTELKQVDAQLQAELERGVATTFGGDRTVQTQDASGNPPARVSRRKVPAPLVTDLPKNRSYIRASSWEDSDCMPALHTFEHKQRPGHLETGRHIPSLTGEDGKTEDGIRNRRVGKDWPIGRLPSWAVRAGGLGADLPAWENPYPHTDAVYLRQEDITDDGLPPIPRAVASQQNLELVMLVKDAQHLPDVEYVQLSSPASKRAAHHGSLMADKRGATLGCGNKSPLITAPKSPAQGFPSPQNRSRSPVRDAKSKNASKQVEHGRTCSGSSAKRTGSESSAKRPPLAPEGKGTTRGEDANGCENQGAVRTKSSLFSIDVSLNEQSLQTDPKRGNSLGGCLWLEQFNLQIPERLVRLARRALVDGTQGPVLHIHLHDSGLYSGQDVLGAGTIAIKQLVDLHKHGQNHLPLVCCLQDPATNAPVLGTDGEQTVINFSFYCLHIDTWIQPSLEDTLRACDHDKIVLRPARLLKNAQNHGSEPAGQSESKMELISLMTQTQKDLEGRLVENNGPDGYGKSDSGEVYLDMPIMKPIEPDDVEKVEFYWKESLEQLMDSIPVNLLVTVLVLMDLVTYLVFSFGAAENDIEPRWMLGLSAAIVSILLMELTLRQIGMGKRFWKSRWNIFDTFVIWLSAAIILFRIIVDSSKLPGFNAVMVLRVVSRVAVGLRVLRVLINYKRARKLHGHVVKELRSTVSQNKRRYVKHGFDLDLTYVTNRVIAMSAPAFGQNSSYRNDIHVVSRFLATRHYGRFFIFNLCDTYYSSDGINGNYNPCMIFNQVQRIPFEDHGPPLMVEMLAFCEEAQMWMMQDVRNVVAIHCKGGKGRTGLMVAAVILWSGHRKTALDALELFTFRRTKNYNPELGMDGTYKHFINTAPCNQTVEGPSQIRYVHYLEAMLYNKIDALANEPMFMGDVSMRNDRMLADVPWYISLTVRCNRYPVFDSLNQEGSSVHVLGGSRDKEIFVWPIRASVWGDVRVDFYRHTTRDKDSKRKLAFFVIFNTCFYSGRPSLVLNKSRIDMLGKDTQHKLVTERFYVSFNFDQRPSAHYTLEREAALWQLVKTYGTRVSYVKGDIIVEENTTRNCLTFVESGRVEGVCYDVSIEQYMHPLGRTACEAISIGQNNERIPAITMSGSKSVVGVSPFLSSSSTLAYRTKTAVQAFELFRRGQASEDDSAPMRTRSGGSTSHQYEEHGDEDFDIGIDNFPDDKLHEFYRGLSVILGRRLSRIQIETIRIGDLESFNDRQSILADQDYVEKLRNSAISQFSLPMNEKLLKSAKCHLKRQGVKNQKMRIIILTNDILFDPEFYGPEVSPKSCVIPIRRLHSVSPHEKGPGGLSANLGIDLRLWPDDADSALATYLMTFNDEETCRGCYELISQACRRAEVVRISERRRPFESACMATLLEKCSIVHRLKRGETLVEASLNSSLFLICSGECRLITRRGGSGGDGRVFTILREGSCVGEVNFALGCSAGHYECVANVPSTVLEIPQARLHKALEHDSARAARFFYVLCLSMEIQIRSLTTHTFPGTWSSGKLMRSKEVEDLRSNMQVQSAPKITRGQTLVLSSISSPKAPASPKKARRMKDKTLASIEKWTKRVPSFRLGAAAGEQGQRGEQDRVLSKMAGSQENLAMLASLHPRSEIVIDDLDILSDASGSRTHSDATAKVSRGTRTGRVARAMSLGQERTSSSSQSARPSQPVLSLQQPET